MKGDLERYLAQRDREDPLLKKWGDASSYPETVFPEEAMRSPENFPLKGGTKLDFRRVDGFKKHHPIKFLIGVHRRLIAQQFPALAMGHHDEAGNFYQHVDEDPRIDFSTLSDPRYKIDQAKISLVRVNNVLTVHYPGVTLVPSKTGYEMGKVVSELAGDSYLEKGHARVFEMGVGSGIIMASALKHYGGENLYYMGGDIDGGCLTACDLTMQLNGFDDDNYDLRKGSGLDPLRGTKVDLIVSNPPYFPSYYAQSIPERGPELAMDGGDDGLDFYRLIFEQGPSCLLPKGKILVQVSNVNLRQVRDLAERRWGKYAKVSAVRQNGRKVKQLTPRGKSILVEFQ